MRKKLALALMVCGCTGLAGTRPSGRGPSGFFYGADEDVTIIAQPGEEAVPGGEEVAEEKSGAFGVRVGMFAPNDSTEGYDSYSPGPLAGVFYRGLQLAEKSLAWELGAELASARANELDKDSNLIRLRASILYGKWYSESTTRFYVSGGGAILSEEGITGASAVLGLGADFGKVDARLGVSFLLGSKNATTATMATVGYLF